MDQQILRTAHRPLLIVFIIITAILIIAKTALEAQGADTTILLIGHTIIFLVTFLAYMLHVRALNKKTGMGIVNAVYGGMIIKMFTCLITAFIYIITTKSAVNKPALFGCMFFYLLYSFIETRIATRLNKLHKNG